MYSVTSTVANLFKTNSKQELSLAVTPVTGSSFTLTSADILANGMNINRYSASGDSIAFGVCSAAELTLRIENYDGRFDSVVFEGAEIYARIGVKNSSNVTQWVPLGYFTVDNSPRRLAVIEISALDRMVQFDKDVNITALNLPAQVKDIVSACCTNCNVTLDTTLTSFPNASFVVQSVGDMENMTYRNVLQWCLQLMGACAYMNHQGHLAIGWYSQAQYSGSPATNVTLTNADRYNSDLFEQEIQITGIMVKSAENQYLYGTDAYALVIDGNPMYTDADVQTIATALSGRVGFAYHPFNASVLPMPYLYPLDMLKFTYKGTTYDVAVTEVDVTSSAPTSLKGTGETSVSKSYARLNPLTSRERAILQNVKDEMNATLSRAINNAIEFNDMISNALGLYSTDVADGSGGTIRYLHDAPTLADSNYIVTMNAGGFAWTNAWNGGDPVWNYGITASGFAMFKRLSAEGIDVTNASSDYSAEVTPEHFNIYYKSELLITIDAINRAIQTPRMVIPYDITSDNYLKIGKLYIYPASDGADALVIGD